jgi:hypothetical protein
MPFPNENRQIMPLGSARSLASAAAKSLQSESDSAYTLQYVAGRDNIRTTMVYVYPR